MDTKIIKPSLPDSREKEGNNGKSKYYTLYMSDMWGNVHG